MIAVVDPIPRIREPWNSSVRIVPSRFPPVGLFDRVVDPKDMEAVFSLESFTNPRLREESGELSLIPQEERVSGPGTTPIMAAFTHVNPNGSRFSDGSYGVYYCARRVETAIHETVHHRERFMREASLPATRLEMRVYYADLDQELHDIRGMRARHPEWYNPKDYGASQDMGRSLRNTGSWGIYYQSVRHRGGECAAVFRPRALSPCRQGEHYAYLWDGTRIGEVLELKTVIAF